MNSEKQRHLFNRANKSRNLFNRASSFGHFGIVHGCGTAMNNCKTTICMPQCESRLHLDAVVGEGCGLLRIKSCYPSNYFLEFICSVCEICLLKTLSCFRKMFGLNFYNVSFMALIAILQGLIDEENTPCEACRRRCVCWNLRKFCFDVLIKKKH